MGSLNVQCVFHASKNLTVGFTFFSDMVAFLIVVLAQVLGADIRQAVANAPDPRTIHPTAMPRFSSKGPPTDNDVRWASQVKEIISKGYMHTLAESGGNPTLLQSSKLGGKPTTTAVKKAEPQVFVQVTLSLILPTFSVIHTHFFLQVGKFQLKWANGTPKGLPKPETPSQFGIMYDMSTPWSNIVEDIRDHVDGKLQKGVNGIRFMESWVISANLQNH